MDAVALCIWVIWAGDHGCMFSSALQSGQWYRMLSRSRKEESDSDDGKGSVNEDDKREKKAVFEVKDVPQHYSREVRDIMTRFVCREAHQTNFYENTVHFRRKWSSCGHVLCHVVCGGHENIHTQHL